MTDEERETAKAYAQYALAALEMGELDGLLPEFIGAYRRRTEAIRVLRLVSNRDSAFVGQTIRFNSALKPAELASMRATVTSVNAKGVVARLTTTRHAGKYQPGMQVRVPFNAYEVVE